MCATRYTHLILYKTLNESNPLTPPSGRQKYPSPRSHYTQGLEGVEERI